MSYNLYDVYDLNLAKLVGREKSSFILSDCH